MLPSSHQFHTPRGRALSGLMLITLVALATLQAFGQATETEPLYKAIRDHKVITDFRGTGGSSGDSVRVRIEKASKNGKPVEVTIPPGTMLHSSNGAAQSMVIMGVRGLDTGGGTFVPRSRIVLASTTPATYILSAFCAEFEKENPSPSDTFTLQEPDPVLACIGKKGRNLSVPAEQAAVWMYTDHMTFPRVNEKFPVSQADWTAAEGVFQQCQASSQGSSGVQPIQLSSPVNLAASGSPLQSAIGDLGVQSGLIARTRNDLEFLRHKGDRNYYEFTLVKGAKPQPVSTVGLQVKESDPKTGKFTLAVTSDDKTIEKKNRDLLEPIQFYTGADHLLYELVVWTVGRNDISGYLSTPKPTPSQAAQTIQALPTADAQPVFTLSVGRNRFEGHLEIHTLPNFRYLREPQGIPFLIQEGAIYLDLSLSGIVSLTISERRFDSGACKQDHIVAISTSDGKNWMGCFSSPGWSVDFVSGSISIPLNSQESDVQLVRNN